MSYFESKSACLPTGHAKESLMKRLSFLILAMALSAGCASQTTVLPQNRIVTLREDKMVSLATLNAAERPAALEAALAVLPKGRLSAVVTSGPAVQRDQVEAVNAVLLRHGLDAQSIERHDGAGNQLDVSFVVMRSLQPVDQPAGGADHWYTANAVSRDYARSMEANMELQAVNPEDLIRPAALGAPNSMAATGPIARYQKGEVRELGEVSMDAGDSGSGN